MMDISKEIAAYRNACTYVGTNKELGEQAKAYRTLKKELLTKWRIIDDNENRAVGLSVLWLFVMVVVVIGLETGFWPLWGFALIWLGVTLLNKPHRRQKKVLEMESERRRENPQFNYICHSTSASDVAFLAFLGDIPEDLKVYRLAERPVYDPHVPAGLTFQWKHLIEREDGYIQFACNTDGAVEKYLIYAVDKKNGRVLDADIQTRFVEATCYAQPELLQPEKGATFGHNS